MIETIYSIAPPNPPTYPIEVSGTNHRRLQASLDFVKKRFNDLMVGYSNMS